MTEKRILVVEDSFVARRLIEAILNPHGYQLLEAPDSQTGLELALEHEPDLILMDLNLPGMSGQELTKRLKAEEKTRHIPVVALTANPLPEEIAQALQAGCVGHIEKPIDTRDFPRQINRFLSHDSTGRSARNE